MKNPIRTFTLLTAIAFFSACGGQSKGPSSLPSGARDFLKVIDKHWVNKDGSWYAKFNDTICQFQDTAFIFKKTSISTADKLNGLKWEGIVIIRASAVRKHSSENGWGRWDNTDLEQDIQHLHFSNVNDSWSGHWAQSGNLKAYQLYDRHPIVQFPEPQPISLSELPPS